MCLCIYFPAFITDKCNEAISNAFKEFWLKEQIASTEDNKTGVAICFSYLRYYLNLVFSWYFNVNNLWL